MKLFGLIGYPLSHSYSRKYFLDKFQKEKIFGCDYLLFELDQINDITQPIHDNPDLIGLNVTIPYKREVIQFLDEIDGDAENIKAVNCIKIERSGKEIRLKGYNTDVFGFEDSLKPLLQLWHQKALIIGTGGSAKAVSIVLEKLGIDFHYVSRNPKNASEISYDQIDKNIVEDHKLIINTSPIGMHPKINNAPDFPYEFLTQQHLLYDLIYNPSETLFLKKGKEKRAQIKNGLEMLHLQAEKSWEIWNS